MTKTPVNKYEKIVKLVAAVVISELIGISGSIFTLSSIPTWYVFLNKPALNPPSWIFAPVWTILYLFMGVAAYLVWIKPAVKSKQRNIALSAFGIQLILNALWSILFFGLHNPFAALIEIVVMWLAILATIVLFSKISRSAAWLLVPYILWVSFAAYLNFSIWQLNGNVKQSGPVACTMEAKLCPDGSAVGRTGPNCEFAPCP
jgi:tryptophan-rich sensory protein